MADIVLAESGGRTWLVNGEMYIDDLLAGTLPENISIEFVACETFSDIDRLWSQSNAATISRDVPWLINPAIVARIRGTTEQGVVFTQWSAQLDEQARATIRKFAQRAIEIGSAEVVLVSYSAPESEALQADLAKLRSAVVEAELATLGVARSRIVRASRQVTHEQRAAAEIERIDMLLKRQ
ncbi:MAG TPA: hypothetical protein VHY82_13785 [Acetobacteraceae bacterium]|jgi:outer membrane protein OmpA-like peptidoglycan-associated protein|nr:hypothetical protein [Acetobacteraceae bacterium]